jgi:4-hydroxy-3-methylbut-2-enyl diphosphate reductase
VRKQDFSPSVLDFGPVQFILPRHFGFCYGVENAIEISYRAIQENPGRPVYLLSQMIHNPDVNDDLVSRGVKFILNTDGSPRMAWEEIHPGDVVIVPAFGTTREIEQLLRNKGVDVQRYNTTCPFVEKVWNRAEKLGRDDYTTIIHGKPNHEETRATFSHSAVHGPSVIVRDMEDSILLGNYIAGERPASDFYRDFEGKFSEGFLPERDLLRVGVVNQTTMLATETQAIADYFRTLMALRYGEPDLKKHFADTRDTLCYATTDNQDATYRLLETDANLAIVVGGYNSSNTSHIVELCERKFTTFFIASEREIISEKEIRHFDIQHKKTVVTEGFLPSTHPVKIVLTSGASCPDTLVDNVLLRIRGFFSDGRSVAEVMAAI